MEKENMVISALNLIIDLVIRADGMLLAKYHVVAIAMIVSIVVSVIFIGQYFGMLCTKLHKAMLSYKASAQIKARKQARSAVMVRPAVVKTKQGSNILASVHISSDCGVYLNWHTMFMLLLCSSHFVDPKLKKMFDADPNMTAAETNTMLSRMPSRDIYDALLDFRNADEAVYDMLNEGEHPYSFKRSEYIKLKKGMVKRLAAGPITFGDLLRLFAHKGTF